MNQQQVILQWNTWLFINTQLPLSFDNKKRGELKSFEEAFGPFSGETAAVNVKSFGETFYILIFSFVIKVKVNLRIFEDFPKIKTFWGIQRSLEEAWQPYICTLILKEFWNHQLTCSLYDILNHHTSKSWGLFRYFQIYADISRNLWLKMTYRFWYSVSYISPY